MWTPTARAQLARGSLPYATCLTDGEWAPVAPFLPVPARRGRPRGWPMRLVLDAIATLPPREKAALVLRDLEGMSSDRVAKILGSTAGTVRSQVAAGRRKVTSMTWRTAMPAVEASEIHHRGVTRAASVRICVLNRRMLPAERI